MDKAKLPSAPSNPGSDPFSHLYLLPQVTTVEFGSSSEPLKIYLHTYMVARRQKYLPANAGDSGSEPGSRSSPEGNGHPLQYSCLENPHGQRSLAGFKP